LADSALVRLGPPCEVTCNQVEAFMATVKQSRPSRLKVQKHRDRLRRLGLRPIQIWVPDVRSPAFRAEAHRQSLATAVSVGASEDQAFIDAVSETLNETR
jgi:Protein  of unknown function (DUF3018)